MAAPSDDAIKHRIISHMNRDHARELSLYLRHYADLSARAASSPQLLDVSFSSMRIRSRDSSVHEIPFSPPLPNWADCRPRVVQMARQAREALGLSEHVITRYVPPEPLGQAVIAAVLFYFACFATVDCVQPGGAVWSFLEGYFPGGGAETYKWVVKVIFWPVVGIHVVECAALDWRLMKHGVERFSAQWWAWEATCFLEGFPSFKRLDGILARMEAEKGKKN